MKFILAITLLTLSNSLLAADFGKKISPVERYNEVSLQLKEKPQTIALYVKGMICESCGVGVKKKIAKLPFLDQKRFTKGYKMDSKYQILYLAITNKKKADYQAINRAVINAGFTPDTYFIQTKGKISSFPAQSK